jgi:hypothetical protein
MVPFKDALCLLAMLFAYGIAGRMDYDDAVMLEQAQQAPAIACGHGRPSTEVIAYVSDPTSDGRSAAFSSAEPDTDEACASASR